MKIKIWKRSGKQIFKKRNKERRKKKRKKKRIRKGKKKERKKNHHGQEIWLITKVGQNTHEHSPSHHGLGRGG